MLKRVEAWYGPSSLSQALHERVVRGPVHSIAHGTVVHDKWKTRISQEYSGIATLDTVDLDDATKITDATVEFVPDNLLLHGTDDDVAAMLPSQKLATLDMLSDRVLDARSESEQSLNEILLARALYRSILF